MKKILLITAILFTSILSAQDWAPFKASDTLVQFKDDSISVSRQGYFIQSMHVKSRTVINTDTVLVFNKGFSSKVFSRNYYAPSYREYLIKGRLLGDSAFINSDSSVFKTMDNQGFQLVFPHHYQMNQNWKVGTSTTHSIHASVDSMYTDSIGSFGIDSIARIQLTVLNANNQPASNHTFHHKTLIVSKKNGSIQLIDFTELDSLPFSSFQRYFISNTPYTINDYNQLTTNDEFHYEQQYQTAWNLTRYIAKITKDTLQGSNRTITTKNTWLDKNTNSYKSNTTSRSFNINTIHYDKKSMLVHDTNFANGYGNIRMLFESTESKPNKIMELQKTFMFSPSQTSSNLYSLDNGSLVEYTSSQSIGYPMSYSSYNFGSNNSVSVVYIKKGIQTWGNPYNFTVGLKENSALENSIQLYPNPVKDVLNINTTSQLQRVRIFTIDGKLQLESQNSTNIDVSHFQAGLYLIEMTTDKGVVTKRLIKE